MVLNVLGGYNLYLIRSYTIYVWLHFEWFISLIFLFLFKKKKSNFFVYKINKSSPKLLGLIYHLHLDSINKFTGRTKITLFFYSLFCSFFYLVFVNKILVRPINTALYFSIIIHYLSHNFLLKLIIFLKLSTQPTNEYTMFNELCFISEL